MNVVEDPNKAHSNSELIEKHKLDGTPFYAIGSQERGYFLALGKFKLSDNYEKISDIENHLQNEFYNVVLKMITAVSESIDSVKNESK